MKTTRKILLVFFLCMPLTMFLLIPLVPAQDTVYNGADTENCPSLSVYPSEVYEFNLTGTFSTWAPETYEKFIIQKANESEFFRLLLPWLNFTYGRGYIVWGEGYQMNATSGMVDHQLLHNDLAYWNESIAFCGGVGQLGFAAQFIPVDSGTKIVSASILNAVAYYFNYSQIKFENMNIFPNIYSIHMWNNSITHYLKANYTEDGILLNMECEIDDLTGLNYTLMSQPAQLPPIFSFDTASGLPTETRRTISLDLTIPAADNNNDGLPDTDYQYRVFEGGIWSDWDVVTPFINYDLGSVPAGNYTLTVEVKNMYGSTQEQIEVEYIPSSSDAIPGFPAVLILVILGFSISKESVTQ